MIGKLRSFQLDKAKEKLIQYRFQLVETIKLDEMKLCMAVMTRLHSCTAPTYSGWVIADDIFDV